MIDSDTIFIIAYNIVSIIIVLILYNVKKTNN